MHGSSKGKACQCGRQIESCVRPGSYRKAEDEADIGWEMSKTAIRQNPAQMAKGNSNTEATGCTCAPVGFLKGC